MPDPSPNERLARVLTRTAALVAAQTPGDVLRAIVLLACAATASPRGLAGLSDGEAATSDAWYDEGAGWSPARLRWNMGEGVPGRVVQTAKPLAGDGAAPDPLELADVDWTGAGRFACLPLPGAGEDVLGFIEVGGAPQPYGAAALARFEDVARLGAQRLREVAHDERRLVQVEAAHREIADRLQALLLPSEPPQLPGFDIAFRYRSASEGAVSGGDFVDYYRRPPSDNLAFAIGDVSGKGVEAMAHTFVAKYVLRAAVHGGQLSWPTHPGSALQELRTGLLEQPDFAAETDRFVTVLFGLISPRRRLLQLASAGHPTPFIVRAGGAERPLLLTEPAIGVELGAALEAYPTETIELAGNDVVVLFTDGIAELRDADGSFFEDVMGDVLATCHGVPADEVASKLLEAADAFSARPPSDDLALLCIRLVE